MKQLILTATLIILANCIFAQRVLKSPRYSARSDNNVQVSKIELYKEQTVIELEIRIPDGSIVNVSSKTYIQSSNSEKKFYIKNIEGLALNEDVYFTNSSKKKLKLHFQALPENTNRINLRAGKEASNWHFFELVVNPRFTSEYHQEPEVGYREADGEKWKYIIYPKYAAKRGHGLKLLEVELKPASTVLHFEYSASPGGWVFIPAETCIQESNGGELLFVEKTEGLNINEKTIIDHKGKKTFTLHFPKLDKKVKAINFKEVNPGGNWFIFEIEL